MSEEKDTKKIELESNDKIEDVIKVLKSAEEKGSKGKKKKKDQKKGSDEKAAQMDSETSEVQDEKKSESAKGEIYDRKVSVVTDPGPDLSKLVVKNDVGQTTPSSTIYSTEWSSMSTLFSEDIGILHFAKGGYELRPSKFGRNLYVITKPYGYMPEWKSARDYTFMELKGAILLLIEKQKQLVNVKQDEMTEYDTKFKEVNFHERIRDYPAMEFVTSFPQISRAIAQKKMDPTRGVQDQTKVDIAQLEVRSFTATSLEYEPGFNDTFDPKVSRYLITHNALMETLKFLNFEPFHHVILMNKLTKRNYWMLPAEYTIDPLMEGLNSSPEVASAFQRLVHDVVKDTVSVDPTKSIDFMADVMSYFNINLNEVTNISTFASRLSAVPVGEAFTNSLVRTVLHGFNYYDLNLTTQRSSPQAFVSCLTYLLDNNANKTAASTAEVYNYIFNNVIKKLVRNPAIARYSRFNYDDAIPNSSADVLAGLAPLPGQGLAKNIPVSGSSENFLDFTARNAGPFADIFRCDNTTLDFGPARGLANLGRVDEVFPFARDPNDQARYVGNLPKVFNFISAILSMGATGCRFDGGTRELQQVVAMCRIIIYSVPKFMSYFKTFTEAYNIMRKIGFNSNYVSLYKNAVKFEYENVLACMLNLKQEIIKISEKVYDNYIAMRIFRSDLNLYADAWYYFYNHQGMQHYTKAERRAHTKELTDLLMPYYFSQMFKNLKPILDKDIKFIRPYSHPLFSDNFQRALALVRRDVQRSGWSKRLAFGLPRNQTQMRGVRFDTFADQAQSQNAPVVQFNTIPVNKNIPVGSVIVSDVPRFKLNLNVIDDPDVMRFNVNMLPLYQNLMEDPNGKFVIETDVVLEDEPVLTTPLEQVADSRYFKMFSDTQFSLFNSFTRGKTYKFLKWNTGDEIRKVSYEVVNRYSESV